MDSQRPFLSAVDLDAMTPDERLAAFRDRIITDPNDLPADFRDRAYKTGRRIAQERRAAQ